MELLTVTEVAARLRISTRQCWKMLSSGKLVEPVRLGRSVRWRAADIAEWVRLGCPSRERFEGERLGALTPVDYWARQAAALLATVADPDRRVDLRELFEHRAAVCEFDGGLSRTDAERIAFTELQAAMGQTGESD